MRTVVSQLVELFHGAFRGLAHGGEVDVPDELTCEIGDELPLRASGWSVVHIYNAYFVGGVDLVATCEAAVRSGFADAAMHVDGTIWWYARDGLSRGHCELQRQGYESSANVRLPEGLEGYQQQFAYEFAALRFFELLHLSPVVLDRLDYARISLGPIAVRRNGVDTPLYCHIKIYACGVFQLLLRRVSGGSCLAARELIEQEVNLYAKWFDRVWLPTGLVRCYWTSLVDGTYPGIRNLRTRRAFHDQIAIRVPGLSMTTPIGDWSFELCDPSLLGYSESEDDDLPTSSTRLNLNDVRAMVITGLTQAVRSTTGTALVHGNYWNARPQTFITDVEGGAAGSATLAIERFSHQMGLILARVASAPRSTAERTLGPNLRFFDDFCVHVNEGGGLWLFSSLARKGIKIGPNDDELVLSGQSKAEFVDYVNAEAHRLAEEAINRIRSFEDVVRVRVGLRELDTSMRSVSQYGELKEYFDAAWAHLRIVDTVQSAERDLQLQTAVLEERTGRYSRRLGYSLAIVFGLVGASGISEKLIEPAFKHWKVFAPGSSLLGAAAYLAASLIMLLLTGLVALSLYLPARRR